MYASTVFVDEEDAGLDAIIIDFKLIRELINREDLVLHAQITSFVTDVEARAT